MTSVFDKIKIAENDHLRIYDIVASRTERTERFVILICPNDNDFKVLFAHNRAEHHFDNQEDCQNEIEAIKRGSGGRVESVFGENSLNTLECRAVSCWESGEAQCTCYPLIH